MNSTCCAVVAVLAALLTGACGYEQADTQAAEDKFISDLSRDAFWKTVDRATAITAGHTFCDDVIEANKQGKTGVEAVGLVVNRYGLESGPILFGAAKRNFCPDVDLG
ncbi:hypothetical protein BH11ACT6_BH11ACT6_02160 [soil metagenome]